MRWIVTASDTLLRVGTGLTLATHGWPKLLGRPHGSMADPMAASVRLIDAVLGLPFAPLLGLLVALLEGVGGVMLALGLATRPLAALVAVQMVAIALALGPTYPWIDRGIEYPIVLGLVAVALAARGGGPLSLDRLVAAMWRERVMA
ncbi:DoxX family protein [Sphingomonas sp. BK235]|jgi:putative oxidoreductase|uniref:DoxX family protein n=1 Tax=Sphingomonas sp. BK235 TaxID=2512131 RepID=UPI00104C455D|nr:DoxX family protein [Sphingomonas sp. BK235]TCP34229.1 putative oxidoreductase [Sphingomonas sp. BK235]